MVLLNGLGLVGAFAAEIYGVKQGGDLVLGTYPTDDPTKVGMAGAISGSIRVKIEG